MFTEALNHLVMADEFDRNALRVAKADAQSSPRWTDTYIQCLGDASRERAVARRLAAIVHDDVPSDSAEAYIGKNTMVQIVRLATIARSAPAGSERMRRAAARMRSIAAFLQKKKAIAQLVWWCGDVEPVPPGRPVICLDGREAGR